MTEDMEKDIELGAGELAIWQEERRDKLYTALLKKTAVVAALFSVIALSFMFVYLSTRSVVLEDNTLVKEPVTKSEQYALSDKAFKMSLSKEGDSIMFSLPQGTKSEDIVIENRVTTCQLIIKVADGDGFYTEDSSITTPSNVTGCLCVPQSDGTSSLEFQLDDIYEYTSTLDNGTLSVSFVNPHEMYDRIVVIDPILGDSVNAASKDDDIALYEALALKDKLEKDGVKAYLSRTDSNEIELVDKKAFIREIEPDLVICIDCAADTSVYYNDAMYLRNYGNDDFAKQVLADISYEVGGTGQVDSITALSLPERPYELMKVLDAPSVLITVPKAPTVSDGVSGVSVDYSYQDHIVTGLYKAVMYAYADMGK